MPVVNPDHNPAQLVMHVFSSIALFIHAESNRIQKAMLYRKLSLFPFRRS
jgi:hypothetical protein